MNIVTYSQNTQISTHFNSKEFKCPHCGVSKISTELINKAEEIFSKINASKCIVSSGYRCPYYDKLMNGFAGRHSESIAMDCCYYDSSGKIIPSKIICCIAFELGFSGIAKIDNNYVHLDIRKTGTYRGDETIGNSSYWTNPYTYFKVSTDEIEKYTKSNKKPEIEYQTHGLKTKWYPNVNLTENNYSGVFGIAIDGIYIDKLKYRVKVDGRWLPEVIGRNDYAGIMDKPITDEQYLEI